MQLGVLHSNRYQAIVWTINITSDMVWQEPNQMFDTAQTGSGPKNQVVGNVLVKYGRMLMK